MELAVAGDVPHYRIDGDKYMFNKTEVKTWIANNLMARCEGRDIPDAIRLVIPAPEVTDKPPSCMAHRVKHIQQLPKHGYQPGVYFLCKEDAVVYVGQSVCPSSRVGTHAGRYSDKDFDRIYLLPCPESDLNSMEGAFIRHFNPSQQGRVGGSSNKPVAPLGDIPDVEILTQYGLMKIA